MFNIFSLRFSCQQEFSEVIQTCKKETGEKENNESSMYKYMYRLLCIDLVLNTIISKFSSKYFCS